MIQSGFQKDQQKKNDGKKLFIAGNLGLLSYFVIVIDKNRNNQLILSFLNMSYVRIII